MENIRERISVKLINNSKDYLRCVSKTNFISQKIFDKNFIGFHQIISVLTLNKPIYVGFIILELSKSLTNKFHYDYCVLNMMQNLQILTVQFLKLIIKMFMNSVFEDCLILVDIQ